MVEALFGSGVAFGLAAMVGWGVGDLTAALLSRQIESVRALTWVTLIGLVLVVVLVAVMVTVLATPVTMVITAIPIIVLASVLNGAGGVSFMRGLQVGQVSLVSPVASGYAVVVVLAAVVVLDERLSPVQGTAVALVLAGSLLASMDLRDLARRDLARRDRPALADPGLPYAFGAMLGWGLGYFLLAVAARQTGWATTALVSSAVLVTVLVATGLIGGRSLAPPPVGQPLALTLATAGCASVANVAYTVGVERYHAALVAPLGAAFPVVTLLLARWLLAERLARWQGLGIGLVLVGVVLVSR